MVKKIFKTIDYGLIIIALLLFGIGIVALYSANGGVNGNLEEVTKQLIWFVVGFICMFIVLLINYDFLRETMGADICPNSIKLSGCAIYTADIWREKLVPIGKRKHSTR